MWRWLAVLAVVGCKGNEPDAAPRLSVSAENLDFGAVPEGQEAQMVVTLTNEGTGEIGLLSTGFSLGDRDVWVVDWERGAVLGAGQGTDVLVNFRPDEPDERFGAELHIRTDWEGAPGVFLQVVGLGAPSINDDDGDGVTIADGDCDDGDAAVFPGAPERCNGVDDDCDGSPGLDEVDEDGDGQRVCGGDCDDADAARFEGAAEVCDQLDNDCDGVVPDDLDEDGDGVSICGGDCNDSDPLATPGGVETCDDNRDNDCDGTVDFSDEDADGHNACGLAPDCNDADPTVFSRTVGPGGDDAAIGSWEEPLATLQAAADSVDAACPTIYLLDGTHLGGSIAGPVSVVGLGAGPTDVALVGPGRVLELTGDVRLRNLTVEDGDITEPGAGIRVTAGSLELRDVVVRNNTGSQGAGVAAVDSTVVLVGDNLFEGNTASGSGGAIHVVGGLLVDQAGATYTDNGAGEDGGAVAAFGPVRMFGALFEDNDAVGRGGALFVQGGSGHIVQGALATSNTAADGGGFAFDELLSAQVRNNVLAANSATHGGAVWVGSGGGALTNNTLVDNTATLGSALYVTAADVSIRANLAHFNAGEGGFWSDLSTIDASHNTVFGTAGADYVGPWSAGVDSNLSENPGFVSFSDDNDPSNDNLNLQASSPSIDSGPADPSFSDLDGSPNDRGHTGGPGAL